jgi:hypothetical protein
MIKLIEHANILASFSLNGLLSGFRRKHVHGF